MGRSAMPSGMSTVLVAVWLMMLENAIVANAKIARTRFATTTCPQSHGHSASAIRFLAARSEGQSARNEQERIPRQLAHIASLDHACHREKTIGIAETAATRTPCNSLVIHSSSVTHPTMIVMMRCLLNSGVVRFRRTRENRAKQARCL
jgi:hypothetical protein